MEKITITYYKVENFNFDEKEKALKFEKIINKYNFEDEQKEQIYKGIISNIDINYYADPKYNWQ